MSLIQPSLATSGPSPFSAGTGSADFAVQLTHVGKCYPIYDRPRDRLKQALFGGRRKFGREFWALRDVNLQIGRGETIGIIGRNGSGKSTLLQIICGTLTPTTGEIKTAGRVAALLELGSGFHPEFTGRENVHLNARILGLTSEQIDERFDRIAAFADIGPFIDQPVKTYSSGMFVRLAFAVIAHVDADVLVIDEALAVGDAFFTQKCMRFLREFRERGTLCFVSHDAAAVLSLCQRAVWLDGGKLRQAGPAKTVSEAYLAEMLGDISRQRADDHRATDGNISRTPSMNPTKETHSPVQTSELPVVPVAVSRDSFGDGGAVILGVDVRDALGRLLKFAEAQTAATVRVHFRALQSLHQPIVGFYLKDRLGQNLFGQNTQYVYGDAPPPMSTGEERIASFSFDMPQLQPGSYTIAVAVADGTTDYHTQHHWIHDAYILTAPPAKGHAGAGGGIAAGLVGIPMKAVEFRTPATVSSEPRDHLATRERFVESG